MKTKFIALFLVIAAIVIFAGYWLLNHSYVIVTFWLGMKVVGVFIVAILLSFVAGRVTKRPPKKSISDTYPPESTTEGHPDPNTDYTKKSFFNPW